MTRRQWAAFGGVVAAAVALTSWHVVTPAVGTPSAVPLERLARFAACVPLSASERRTIAATRHYLVSTPVLDTTGKALPGHYVWVYAPDTAYGVYEHEWMHLVLKPDGDPWHTHPRWAAAQRCGAIR